jgi:hypothetical protein
MITERTAPAETLLLTAVAGEIREIRGLIERIADLLVSDARFTTDYIDQFQTFDLIAQCADESASLLDRLAQGLSAEESIARVRLTAVQQRLNVAMAKE